MKSNLLIPCSGPGTRSAGYSKFHKALIRVGDCAVIDHIINSYTNINKIFVMLGYQSDYVREYLDHAGYNNIEYIEIENWSEGQIPSFRQLPERVFDQPIYYNACDNWSQKVPVVENNTFFTCNPNNSKHYDTDGDLIYAGISFMKDAHEYYECLQRSNHNRNDLLIMKELSNLEHHSLDTWYDVGNRASYQETKSHYVDNISVLDKKNQEVFFVNQHVVKLWDKKPYIETNNPAFPHPGPVKFSTHGLSYPHVDGTVNVHGDLYIQLLNSLTNLWNYCLVNNISVYNKTLWQDKTWKRFNMMCSIDEKYAGVVSINGYDIDCTKQFEKINWDKLNWGIFGPCHGDLTMDNIIMTSDNINYIDHRPGKVTDIFYDICKFYLSLFVNCVNLDNLNINDGVVNLNLDTGSDNRISHFRNSEIYKKYSDKIELGVAVLCLCMAPLNVDKNLNHKLWLLGMMLLHTELKKT